jgi:hypothetical protein
MLAELRALKSGAFQLGRPEKELSEIDLRIVGDATGSLDPCVAGQEPLPVELWENQANPGAQRL